MDKVLDVIFKAMPADDIVKAFLILLCMILMLVVAMLISVVLYLYKKFNDTLRQILDVSTSFVAKSLKDGATAEYGNTREEKGSDG